MNDEPDDIWSKYPDPTPRREWLTPRVLAYLAGAVVIMTFLVRARELVGDILWSVSH